MARSTVLLGHAEEQLRTGSGRQLLRVLVEAYDRGGGSAVKELIVAILKQEGAIREEDAEGDDLDAV